MTNAKMHAIQVQDTPVLLKRTLSPSLKLLRERLVETTDCAGAGSHSQQRLGHSPTLWVLVPATNICVNPSAMWGS